MRTELHDLKGGRRTCRTPNAAQAPWLVALAASSACLGPMVLGADTARAAAQPAANQPAAAQSPIFVLPPPIAEASALIDRGRVDEATALLALAGRETLAQAAEPLYKVQRAEVAKCQYFLGADADCLDNAGMVLRNAPRHPPPGAHYYGALAATRMRLWPLVVLFTRGDPEALAGYLLSLGDRLEESWVRRLNLHLAVALARMDRFDEARQRMDKLARTARNEEEAAALRACLAQLADRERAVRAGQIKRFDASRFWFEALESPSWWVQIQAMGKVRRLPDPRVFDKLAARLKHPRWEVREAAAGALGARGDRRALGLLRPLQKDPHSNVRSAARLALKSLGEKLD